jgi:hypothetical protein
MANVLPFSTATLGGTSITAAEFVYGSGRLTYNGTDGQVTLANGLIRHVRKNIVYAGACELYGDKTSLNTAAGLSASQVVGPVTFNGIVTATYNHDRRTTSVEIKGDPA